MKTGRWEWKRLGEVPQVLFTVAGTLNHFLLWSLFLGGLPSPKWWCTVLVSRSLMLPYSRLLLVLGVISDVIVKGPSVGYSFLFNIVFVFINLVFA